MRCGTIYRVSTESRDRKVKSSKNQKTSKRTDNDVRPLSIAEQPCECPACQGEDLAPEELVGELLTVADGIAECDDPLEAEISVALLIALGAVLGPDYDDLLATVVIPEMESVASADALATLLVLVQLGGARVAKAAESAAQRLTETGVARPPWAGQLDEASTVDGCSRLVDSANGYTFLCCSVHRSGQSHSFLTAVNEQDCGAAEEIFLVDTDQLPSALDMIKSQAGATAGVQELSPAELRWQLEAALDARAVHDAQDGPEAVMSEEDEDAPPYPAVATLLRARLRHLPESEKPKPAHGSGEHAEATRDALASLLRSGSPNGIAGTAGEQARSLPPARDESAAAAPVYRIKVGLRGAKPPIWRRLEVIGDCRLDELHETIQIAFDWYDGHLHVFETPYGDSGMPDSQLGHGDEADVTLEQVLPSEGDKIRYIYDFGDDWDHEIRVEKVITAADSPEGAAYPRCTGGRRAAPPEDCGGIYGYLGLIETLRDPSDVEHGDMLDWLGLADAAEFDPAEFDAKAVTRALSGTR